MSEKTNLFTVFWKEKSLSCHVPSISRSNTYCIYIFRKNIMLYYFELKNKLLLLIIERVKIKRKIWHNDIDTYLNIQTIIMHKIKQIAKPPDDSANIVSQWYLVGPLSCSKRKKLLFNRYTCKYKSLNSFFYIIYHIKNSLTARMFIIFINLKVILIILNVISKKKIIINLTM